MSRRILAAIRIMTLGIAIAASSANAQAPFAPNYVDIAPDFTSRDWEGYSIQLGPENQDRLEISNQPAEIVISTTSNNVEVMFDSHYPAALHLGSHIGPQGNWRKPNNDVLNRNGVEGYWIGIENRFLPVRFRTAEGWHYAWVRLSIDAQASYFTLKDYAVSTSPNVVLAAGRKTTAEVAHNKSTPTWSFKGREFTTIVDCEITMVSIQGALIRNDFVAAGQSHMIDIEPGMYLIAINSKHKRGLVKVVIK